MKTTTSGMRVLTMVLLPTLASAGSGFDTSQLGYVRESLDVKIAGTPLHADTQTLYLGFREHIDDRWDAGIQLGLTSVEQPKSTDGITSLGGGTGRLDVRATWLNTDYFFADTQLAFKRSELTNRSDPNAEQQAEWNRWEGQARAGLRWAPLSLGYALRWQDGEGQQKILGNSGKSSVEFHPGWSSVIDLGWAWDHGLSLGISLSDGPNTFLNVYLEQQL